MAVTTVQQAPHRGRSFHVDAQIEQLACELAVVEDEPRKAELVEDLVSLTLPMADAIALRYQRRGIETEDLIQVARTALVLAISRYRPGAGPGFTAYASPTISGEVKRWFRDHGWTVRPPRRVQELRPRLAAEQERLSQLLGRDPSEAELAMSLQVTRAEVAEVRLCSSGYYATSLDAPAGEDTTLADVLLVSTDHAATVEDQDALRGALARLTDRDRRILELRFVEELTQSEVGERIGVSQMQVSRILSRILRTLRADLLAEGPSEAA